ncbi:hypothetical protein ACFL0H_06135 [Thermodesulfobacteriota bacterium]
MKFQKLFEPIKISDLEMPNRVVLPPLSSGSASDGSINDRIIAFYRELAGSGAGLIIVEDSIVAASAGLSKLF